MCVLTRLVGSRHRKEHLDKVLKGSRKKLLSINSKNTEFMVISNSPKSELKIADTTVNQVQKFSSLGRVISSDEKI